MTYSKDLASIVANLWAELVDGASGPPGPFMLNSGDAGLLRSLDALSAADASQATNAGASIAAHAQHVRFGLSLMNLWAREGGNPFADAKWDEAWKVHTVTEAEWQEIKTGLRDETHRWLEELKSPREVAAVELGGIIGSVGHLAYHLGAIRQISKAARGPREGTFTA